MLLATNGLRLFTLEAGRGEPELVFIHGNGADHAAWHGQIAHFSKSHRVIAVDLRGHGHSSADPSGSYDMASFVADLAGIFTALEVNKAVLVGWSMGATIVARFAVEYPERVAGVVLVDCNLQAARNKLGVDGRLTYGVLQHLAEDFAGRGVESFVAPWFPEQDIDTGALKEWLQAVCRRTGQEVVYAIRRRGAQEDRTVWLKNLPVPTLITQGGASPLGGPAMGEFLHGLIPDSRLHVFASKGHAPFLTAPQEFNRVVGDFVRQISQAAGGKNDYDGKNWPPVAHQDAGRNVAGFLPTGPG